MCKAAGSKRHFGACSMYGVNVIWKRDLISLELPGIPESSEMDTLNTL